MSLNYYYQSMGRKIVANLNDLEVSKKSSTDKNCKFTAKCSFNKSNKRLEMILACKDFKCDFKYGSAEFKDKILEVNNKLIFDYKGETILYIDVSLNGVLIFELSEKIITVKIDTIIRDEKRTPLTSVFAVRVPFVLQKELKFIPPVSKPPGNVVQGICLSEFKMTKKNSKEEIEQCIDLEEFRILDIQERYRVHGYAKMLNLFLEIENFFEMKLIEKFAMSSVKLLKTGNRRAPYKIPTAADTPSIVSFVELILMDEYVNEKLENKTKFLAAIKHFFPKRIEVCVMKQKSKKINKLFDDTKLYRVEFVPNFFSSAVAKRAIDHIKKHDYENFMLNFTLDAAACAKIKRFGTFEDCDFEWLNENISTNKAQMRAVKNIVNRTNFPSPFICFGGPGCGKTSLAVEAIAQIVKLLPHAKILVTTNSNSACDEIGNRLLAYVGKNQIFRFYSPSLVRRLDKISKQLMPLSNLKSGTHIPPSYQEITNYNVIISTLVNSGRLLSLSSKHFDFIFVDECASVSEAYVNIPFSLAIDKRNDFFASIVLLGDPKQLGQITKTHHTERFGFNISMMERMMKLENYQFDEKRGGYNEKFIVQLTDNFRSHAAIIGFSNKEFYNSRLVSCQKRDIADFAIGWEHLPNKEYPLIFQASWTKSDESGTSLYNNGELHITKKYVNLLLKKGINGKSVEPSDIGIISPYASQREKLKEMFKNGIEIGTVEYFQGREKLIIIFSCVRSKTKTIGFLKNEKRLNVALTRAKALLIVIGNPETLGQNKYWRSFITLCHLKNAIVGNVPMWVIRRTKKDLHFVEDGDDAIRLEEMINAIVLGE